MRANPNLAVISNGITGSIAKVAESTYIRLPHGSKRCITDGQVGGAFSFLVYNGKTYTGTKGYTDPNADLAIWHVLGTFNSYAPLYTGSNETGLTATQPAMLIGRGTPRGAAVTVNNVTKGWQWGTADSVQSWGQNAVSSIFNLGGQYGQTLQYHFDAGATNEGALSNGDSGGGEYILD